MRNVRNERYAYGTYVVYYKTDKLPYSNCCGLEQISHSRSLLNGSWHFQGKQLCQICFASRLTRGRL